MRNPKASAALIFCWVFGLGLLAWCFGCQVPQETVAQSRREKQQCVVSISRGSTPRLTTNEVFRIAHEFGKSKKIRLDSYVCSAVIFKDFAPTNSLSGKWILHYELAPPSPDLDFFIDIDDRTGTAELVR